MIGASKNHIELSGKEDEIFAEFVLIVDAFKKHFSNDYDVDAILEDIFKNKVMPPEAFECKENVTAKSQFKMADEEDTDDSKVLDFLIDAAVDVKANNKRFNQHDNVIGYVSMARLLSVMEVDRDEFIKAVNMRYAYNNGLESRASDNDYNSAIEAVNDGLDSIEAKLSAINNIVNSLQADLNLINDNIDDYNMEDE